MTNSTFGKTITAATAIAVAAIGFSASANAQARETHSAVVQYADLDLTSATGQATFQGRIKGAVRKVCGSYDTKVISEIQDHGRCVDEASLSAKKASVTIMAAAAARTPIETAMVVRK